MLYSVDPVCLPGSIHRQKDHQSSASRRRRRQIRHPPVPVNIFRVGRSSGTAWIINMLFLSGELRWCLLVSWCDRPIWRRNGSVERFPISSISCSSTPSQVRQLCHCWGPPPPPAPFFFCFQKVDKVVEVRNGIGRVIPPGCEVGISPATSSPFQKSFCLRKEDKKKKEKEIK